MYVRADRPAFSRPYVGVHLLYSDGDNIIIIYIIIIIGFLGLGFYVGFVGITLVALVFRW